MACTEISEECEIRFGEEAAPEREGLPMAFSFRSRFVCDLEGVF